MDRLFCWVDDSAVLQVMKGRPPRRRFRLIGVVVTLGAALTACSSPGTSAGGGGHTPSASPQSRQAAIDAALEAMSGAVASGSARSFTSVVDPAATAFRTHWDAVFAGLHRMQFQRLTYSWDGQSSLPVPAGTSYGAGAVVAVVTMRYCLPSWDAGCVADAVPLTFAPVGGHWYLESDSQDADRLPLGVAGEPWNLGDVSTATQADVLVVGGSGQASAYPALAGRVHAAITAVRALWPVPSWNGRVVVYASADPRFVRQYFGTSSADVASTIAVLPSHPVVKAADSLDPSAVRLIVTPQLVTEADAAALVTLRREVARIAFALEGGPPPPTWLVEGVADYTAFHPAGTAVAGGAAELAARGMPAQLRKRIRQGTWNPSLPTDSRFYRGSAAEQADAYTSAWLTCLYIANHYGQAALGALFDAAAQGDQNATPAQVERDMLSAVLHTDRAHLLGAVKAYARSLA